VFGINIRNTMGKQLSVRIDDDLEELIEKEKAKSPYEPSESDIVRAALRDYLQEDEEGNAEGNGEETTAAMTAD